jgi:NADH-quinone oxidoreductase subunit G
MSAEMNRNEDMVDIEVDGIPMQAPKGSMIIEATDRAGIEIPRFCYHPKLSIAANCRMCLVDVEKAPKPLPACATPVMDGMKVYTASRRAMDAQHGVMEFLLINHPLDCPICDQGGECELQDLAMGYGRSVSRFTERKRVVKDKYVGPLVQTEMTRCIHCTRCVRFLEEIAGTSEMGGAGRGDRVEIGTCVQNSINSELSANIIDICPVGALTNKPFRFAARAWELMAKPSVALHDGIGSSLFHHVRRGQVLRTVPRDNEATNETWLSDRDRFSQSGLYTQDRVTSPQVKENGEWKVVSWNEAVETVARMLKASIESHGAESIGCLMSPSVSSEEYLLAQRLVRQLECGNIDYRLREQDFSDDLAAICSAPFEKKIAEIENCDAILLVGSNPREEAPLLGHRIRKAWKNGAQISVLNPLDWKFTFETSLDSITAPQHMAAELAALAAAVAVVSGNPVPKGLQGLVESTSPGENHQALARRLHDSDNALVLLGQFAMSHPAASWLRSLASYIAQATGAAFNLLPHGGNSAGARMAGALPHRGPGGSQAPAGLDAAQMLADPRQCYLLWGLEPELDIDNPARAMHALGQADSVISVASHASDSLREVSDILLPLAPQPESEGSMVNLDGTVIGFKTAGKASQDVRAGWRILRRLGSELSLNGFEQVSLEDVQADLKAELEGAEPASEAPEMTVPVFQDGFYRLGEIPMYSVDALCRRSEPLQQTEQARNSFLGLNPKDAEQLGLVDGASARVSQGEGQAEFEVRISERVPTGGVWLRSATHATRELGNAIAPVSVEVV